MPDDDRRRWNARYSERSATDEPARFLVERAALLPTHGHAIDVAGGTGHNARWLASRGLSVTLVDVADEACRIATQRAREDGIDLEVIQADLTHDPLPAGPWDVVLIHHFLAVEVVQAAPELLASGGLLLWCQPTMRNLERHPRPSRRWLLAEGELSALVQEIRGVEVVALTEGWTEAGRHEAHLVLRAPASGR